VESTKMVRNSFWKKNRYDQKKYGKLEAGKNFTEFIDIDEYLNIFLN